MDRPVSHPDKDGFFLRFGHATTYLSVLVFAGAHQSSGTGGPEC